MFNAGLKKQIEETKQKLEIRLQALKDLLSKPDLDDKLRKEIEAKAARVKQHLEGCTQKMINGGF